MLDGNDDGDLNLPDGYIEHALAVYSYVLPDPPVFEHASRFLNDNTWDAAIYWQAMVEEPVVQLPDEF